MPEILPKAAMSNRVATLAARGEASASHSHRTIPEDVAIPGKHVDFASEVDSPTTHPNFRDRWFGAKHRGRDAGPTMIEVAEVAEETPS